jgi:hypothetical protein
MREYNLRIGKAVVCLAFRREGQRQAFIDYFRRPSHAGPADIRLDLKFRKRAKAVSEIPNSLFLTKEGGGEGFSAAGGLVAGRFSASRGEGELIVDELILEGNFARVFEQILYQAYWSAARRKGLEALLLHSSGIARKGKGYVFTGKSGSGKSTVTALSPGSVVLNDEITVIDLSGLKATVGDTPFNGFFVGKEEGEAPLSALFLLEQAAEHRLTEARDAESVKRLSREIIPPMGLETPLSPSIYWEMLGYAQKLSEALPLFKLEFSRDGGFWRCIDEMEGQD